MTQANNMIDLLEAGIKVEGLRQTTIASNMANLGTPGYRRLGVKFEEMLAKALDSAGTADLSDIEPELFTPNDTPVKSNGNNVDLESEVGELVKNSLRHTAYVRILQKKFAQIEAAMRISG